MDLGKILIELSNSVGVSGEEDSAAQIALDYLKQYNGNAYIKNGNVIANFGNREEGKPHILIDAHIDQIGLIVSYITDDGFIKVGNVGGIDRRLVFAQEVVIHGKEPVIGIISSIPPHLSSSDEKKVPEISDILIDTGYTKEELSELISLGDKISFKNSAKKMLNDRYSGVAFDDRSGVLAILRVLDILKNDVKLPSFTVLFSTQEELGTRGSMIAGYDINPDISIAVDVSFALTADDCESKCGKLNDGPMIGISPSLSREVSNDFIEIAKCKNIPYQIEVMGGLTSTNADSFAVSRGGSKAVTISIPLKYMHTPVEVVALSDIENTAILIAEYIRRFI